MKTFLKIFLGILAVPVSILCLLAAYIIIAEWPVNYCEKMEGEREQCLTNPPEFSEGEQSILEKYHQEFQIRKEVKKDWTVFSDAPEESLKVGYGAGYIDPASGAQLVVSTQGSSTAKGMAMDGGKNLYVRMTSKDPWEQVVIPDKRNVGNAYWITQYGSPKIFASLNNRNFYLYDPSTKNWSYLFWGWGEHVSPDHKKVLIKRGYGGEFFSYFIWDVETDLLMPLFMIQENHASYIDTRWKTEWSDDSQAIDFYGETKLLGKFHFFYHIPSAKTYRIF